MSELRAEPGTTLGSYELKDELGRGTLGVVYRARHIHLERPAAVKVLHPHWTAAGDFVRRFRDEGRVLARLEHPHILRVYDAGEDRGLFFLATQYLEGRNLEQLIHAPIPQRAAVHVARQVAAALVYAHAQGVIHRDVKPANIMVGPRGEVTLMDFGVARLLDAPARTLPEVRIGTPTYMAPEQIRGHRAEPRSDLYALGVVLYQMLAGIPPFAASDSESVFHGHLHEEPPSLGDVVPLWLQRVVRKALAKEPEERFPTVDQFLAALSSEGEAALLAALGVSLAELSPPLAPAPASTLTEAPLLREQRTALSLDIVGSRRMKLPGRTVAVVRRFGLFREYVRRHLEAHGGARDAVWAGDGLVALFVNPQDAARCARALLDGLDAFNASHRDQTPIAVRIGLHAGPILREPGQPLGEITSATLDLAGHLQKYGEKNTILASQTVLRELDSPQGWSPAASAQQEQFELPIYAYPSAAGVGEVAAEPVPATDASAPEAAPAKLRLRLTVGDRQSEHLIEEEALLGRPDPRGPRVSKLVIDGDDAVSRRHAQISRLGSSFLLEDLDSANHTYLNGEALLPGKPVPLAPGDEIRLGEHTRLHILPS